MPRASQILNGLPDNAPFVGPETLEREIRRPFKLRLGANESPFGPSPLALEAIRLESDWVQNYGDPEGWNLRTAIAQAHGIQVPEVVLSAGIDDLLSLFCRAFADAGSIAVTTFGSYPTFEYGALSAGLTIVRVPYRDERIDLEALLVAAKESDARIIYLANPDNPSGSCHSARELDWFVQQLPIGTLLLLDEAYVEYASSPLLKVDPGNDQVVHLRTFSKVYGMAGMRVAYAMGHEKIVRLLDRVRMHFAISRLSLAAAQAAWEDLEFVKSVVACTNSGRDRISRLAVDLGLRPLPSATNFVTIDTGSRNRADRILLDLRDRGVFIRKPGTPPLDSCIRATIGRPDQLEMFEAIFREVVSGNPIP
jgi:histidinol-phosphate aminotransferase